MSMLMTKLEDREKWQWYKSHDVILAATMNHLDIVISSMCVQVFGINAARKGTFSLDMVDLSCLRRGLRRLEKKAIKTGFELSVSHPLELKGLGATVVLEKDLLHLIISRPVLDQTPFNLYELLTVATPTVSGPHALSTGERFYIRFNPEKRYLIINREHTLYFSNDGRRLSSMSILRHYLFLQ